VSGIPEGYCGSGLSEEVSYNDDGTYSYRTAMKTTCDWINTEYTVY
jgi:hypothetical protein